MRALSNPAACSATLVAIALSVAAPAAARDYAREGAYVGVDVLGGTYTYLDDIFGNLRYFNNRQSIITQVGIIQFEEHFKRTFVTPLYQFKKRLFKFFFH